MGDWVSIIADSFGRDLVCGAVKQLRYPCCFNGFVEDLQGVQHQLIATKDSVNDRVEHDKKQAMKTAQVIHAWLEPKANNLKDNVEHLLEEASKNKSCCFGHCPNWIWRYSLAKKLEEKKKEVEKCIVEGSEYVRYERVASLPGIQHLPWEKPLEFDSRQGAYKQLIETLKDDEVTMFGLYGMGGCGKTTMAMELMRIAEAEYLFDKVLLVPVSNNVEVQKIQDNIASALQFKFPEDGERERAQRLCERLTLNDMRTLVILDDLWQSLDFGRIGIPFGENHKNCKVMITTRLEAVCTSMDCKKISLSILTDEEAWELFQKEADISENTPNTLKDLGRIISNECKGLPVAIAALAGTLKGKAEVDWKVALERLRSSTPMYIEKDLPDPYKCLEVSYNNLETKEAKALLLLCSVYPKDYEIPVEGLTIFAIGLGLVGEVGSFEGARNEVSAAKNKLISSSLLSSLVDDDEEECVKMHDLIRDVAHWIASKENQAIKCELRKDMTWECSSIRYLCCKEFPNELDCSCIEFLWLETKLEVSDELFKGMKRLRVLILHYDGIEIGSLSTMSFKLLTNLSCLVLSCWTLGDLSSMGYMKKLESLELFACSFFELPDTVTTQLTNLRLLRLSKCVMKRNHLEAIGRHLRLEELYYDDEEGSESDFGDGDHAVFFKMSSVPQALRRYRIKFGSIFEDFGTSGLNCHRVLILSCFDTSNAVVMELAKKSEGLLVANILGGAKNVIPDIFQKGGGGAMNCGWIELWLRYSKEIECLVDTSNHSQEVGTPFKELRKLRIEYMERLGALYHGVPPSGLFEKLEQLYIEECPMMTCLLTPAAARSLVQLQELEIFSCGGLKHILEDDNTGISRHDDKLVFSKLKLLHIGDCSMLENIIPVTFAQGLVQLESLEELYIEECLELHGTLFDWKLNLCSLKALELYECPELRCVFTYAAAQSVVHLEKLEILYCDGLKHVLEEDGSREEEETSDDDHMLVFPKLKLLTVRGCKKIEYIIPVTLAQGLLQLECLEIEVDRELKYVFGPCILGANQSQKELKIELPLLAKLTLVNLPNIISICPTNCYATCPSLCQFALRNCPEFSIVSINTCTGGSEGRQCDHNTTKMKSDGLDIIEIQVKDLELAGIFQVAERSIDREEDPLTKCLQKLSCICNALILSMNLQNLDLMEVSGSRRLITRGPPQLKKFMTENCNQADQIFTDENGVRQHFLNLHLEFNDQLEGFPENISNPLAPLVNYNSGPWIPCNLKTLILKSCSMLRTLFAPSTAIRLTSLEELMISECHDLRYIVTCKSAHENKEEIIPEDHESQSCGSMFPRLRRINVMNCNSLEYILHVSFAQNLVELKDIEVRHAPQLRYVFGENIHDHVHSSNQYQDKIQIELPILEQIALFNLPNMINVCPDNYYATCPSLQRIVMNDVELSSLSISNLMVTLGSTQTPTIRKGATHSSCSHSSALDIRAIFNMANGQALGSVAIWNSSKIKGIFHLEEFPKNGPQVTSWLKHLNLVNLPELRYIWKGAKHLVTLQNLSLLYIWGCPKLKAIFSPCVVRSLPQLKILVVLQCDELEQIIEDEKIEIVSNLQSTKVCFSKLKLLLVTHCNKLKRMFYLSTSHDFPELEYLIINQNPHLEEVFEECKRVEGERRVEVSLPELKHVVLMQLPNLNNISQGIEFKGVTNILVHNCPKLSLATNTTAEDMLRSYCHDRVIDFFVRCDLLYIRDIINKENAKKDGTLETSSQLQMNPRHQPAASCSKVLSSQVIGCSQPVLGNLVASVHKLNRIGSGATESHDVLTLDRKNKGSQDLQSLEHKLSLVPSANSMQSIEGTKTTKAIREVLELVEPTLPTFGSELVPPIHKVPSSGIIGESSSGTKDEEEHLDLGYQDHTSPKTHHDPSITEKLNSIVECGELPAECVAILSSLMNQQNSPGETRATTEIPQSIKRGKGATSHNTEIVTSSTYSVSDNLHQHLLVTSQHKSYPHSIDDKIKESIQEGSASKDTTKVFMPTGTEGNGSGAVVVTYTELGNMHCQKIQNVDDNIPEGSHLMDKEGEMGVVANSSIEVHPGLEAFEDIVDLDDGQIALLAEAITVYPDLWKILEKFSVRFKAVEEDDAGQILTPSVFVVTEEHCSSEDSFVVKVIADLEETLKMPLKDIASSEANRLHLLTALKFLSQLPLEDLTLSGGLKAVINSLHQEFPSILCSFNQAFAAAHKFAVHEGFKKEFENVRRDKSPMMEDSRKARQQLFEVNYKWSALCSQFELNRIAARRPS